MLRPECLGEEIMDQLIRRVLVPLDLFQDHVLLAGDLFRVEHRVLQHVRQDILGQWHVLGKHLDVITGVLSVGKGIDLAADGVQFFGNPLGGAALGAFEEEVLDKVRDAGRAVRFVPAAGIDPDAERDGLDIRDPLGHDADAIGRAGEFVHKLGATPGRGQADVG